MAESGASRTAAIAQAIQEKYEFYFVALIFTILGLAVETAQFGTLIVADVAELLAWVALLTAGLAAMSRIEFSASVHALRSQREYQEELLAAITQARAVQGELVAKYSGEALDPGREASVAKTNIATLKTAEAKPARAGKVRYWMARIGFIVGIGLLMISRGANGLSVWWS